MGMDRMAPWDALPWFDFPVASNPVTVSPNVKLCLFDPMRVILILANPAGTTGIVVSPDSTMTSSVGMPLTPQFGPLILTQEQYGVLTAVEWFGASSVIGATISVIEVRLRDYPKGKAARGQFERALAKAARLRDDYNHGRGSRPAQSQAGWADRFAPWASNERGE